MQDFSSSAYWNKVYSSGEDDSGQQAVSEWHVEGDVFVEEVERLLPAGGPSSATMHTAAGREEVAVLNVGCGTSTLWERWALLLSMLFSSNLYLSLPPIQYLYSELTL